MQNTQNCGNFMLRSLCMVQDQLPTWKKLARFGIGYPMIERNTLKMAICFYSETLFRLYVLSKEYIV